MFTFAWNSPSSPTSGLGRIVQPSGESSWSDWDMSVGQSTDSASAIGESANAAATFAASGPDGLSVTRAIARSAY